MKLQIWYGLLTLSMGILSQNQVLAVEVSSTEMTNAEENSIWTQIDEYNQQQNSLQQITNVSQLRDVSPQDWAFEALQNLVERYGCISGYPNGTFQKNRSITRYEFAAGLNGCLQKIESLISQNRTIPTEDLQTVEKLSQDFQVELTALGTRIDNLEGKVKVLEDRQFSVTTKLKGEIAFAVTGIFGEEKANSVNENLEDNIVFDNRIRLNFDTSFTGKDLLKVRLDALNTEPLGVSITGTNMTRLAFDGNTDNSLEIGQLFYRFPITKKLRVTVDGTGGRFFSNTSNFNSFFSDPLIGSISRFGRFNPIYLQGVLGAGVTGVYKFNDNINLSLGYLARNADNPNEENGLFNGSYAALAQLAIAPTKNLDLGLTYVHSYYPEGKAFVSGATGSRLANAPFGSIATSADHFGLELSYKISPDFIFAGWGGLTEAHAQNDGVGFGNTIVDDGDNATIFNWAVTLAFPDFLGSKRSFAGLVIGQPPKVTSNDSGAEDPDTAWHLEADYRYQVNDHITINPGLLVILNPEHDSNNDTIWVGTVRTVFNF